MKTIIIGAEQDNSPCEYCGQVEELRPYGKNGAKICFGCAMQPENKANAEDTFAGILNGTSEQPTKEQSN